MNSGLTPEKIKEIGEQVRDFVLATTKPENVSETLRRRILETTTPEERLAGLDVEERLAGQTTTPEERLAGLDVEENRCEILFSQRPSQKMSARHCVGVAGMSAAERRALLRLLQEELDTGASEEARGNGGRV